VAEREPSGPWRPGEESSRWFGRAREVMPGGVSSPVRAFRAVGADPYVVARGEGAYVVDVDGRRYLDYVQSWGASILGHAHPAVLSAIGEALRGGTTFGAPTVTEVLLAEEVAARVPGCDQLRFTSSGTEAVMTAVRLARGATGRRTIVVFAGCYHGHADTLLAAGGSGVATLGLPASAGVPPGAVADTVVAPYNVVPTLDSEVACVVVEPAAANMGLVPPVPGFLEGLRRACDGAGALLVFDEVITGFRVGRQGAAGLTGVVPDLYCFGKVLGGGLPLAAVGGRRDLLRELAPEGPVYQAGTLSGNPLATAAGLATLRELGAGRYEELAARVGRLASGLAEAIVAAGLSVQVPVFSTLLGLAFAPSPVRDLDGARAAAGNGLYARFFLELLAEGVALAPSPYEILFPSLAHGDEEVERTVEAAGQAARRVAASAA